MLSQTVARVTPRAPTRPLPVSGDLTAATWLSGVVVVLLVITASAGLLYGGDGLYTTDPRLLSRFYGQDSIALVGAVPALLISMAVAHRGSVRGLVVWLGVLLYVAYWFHFYLTGIPFGPLFLVHVGLVSGSVFAIATLLARVDVEQFRSRMASGMRARLLGRFVAAVGVVFAVAWATEVIAKVRSGEMLDPAVRSVYAVDLTLMLPATIVAGIGLWKHRPWGYLLAGPLLVNAFASMLTLAATSVVIALSGEPVGLTQLVLFPAAALATLLCAAVYLRDVRF